MKLKCMILLAFVAIGGCTPASLNTRAQVYPPLEMYQFTQADYAAIEFGVRRSLKDPFSAVFGEVKAIIDARKAITVCGTVNAKNGFGGYSGFVPYAGVLATNQAGDRIFLVNGIGDVPGSTKSVALLLVCRDRGVPFQFGG